jgi:hypothetical protein
LLLHPTRVGLHCDLEVRLVAVAVDPERRVQVGVTEGSRCCVDPRGAPKLGGEVSGEVRVEAVRDIASDESSGLQLPVPPTMDGLAGSVASVAVS